MEAGEAQQQEHPQAGDEFSLTLFSRLLEEEFAKLRAASHRDVHDESKETTLPIARDLVDAYVQDEIKLPWFIDLLNLTLGINDRDEARRRIAALRRAFADDGRRITENVDF